MQIHPGNIHVWKYLVMPKPIPDEKASLILSSTEIKKSTEFINKTDSKNYICHHLFLRNVLSNYSKMAPSEIKFDYSEFGKPYIQNSNLNFNLSYRGKYSMLAISADCEIGVDLEKTRLIEDPDSFATVYFTEKEKKYIFAENTGNISEKIIHLWTMKEAFIKAVGKGLTIDIGKIDLSDFFNHDVNLISYQTPEIWTIKNIPVNAGYRASVAANREINDFIEFNYAQF